jgi:GrpB-like predicted nucleotidyltransferase (UPF0157 family)
VIDIMLGIPSLRAPVDLFLALSELGYAHRPLDTVADRLYFVKDIGTLRSYNLSVCEADSSFWNAHVRFRDSLRFDSALARSYAELKRTLAAKYPDDRLAYTDAKDQFVAAVLKARALGV